MKQQDLEMPNIGAGNSQFTDENTPHLRLWRGLQPLLDIVQGLESNMKQVYDQLVPLDAMPYEDSIVDENTLKNLARTQYGYVLWAGHNRLSHSLSALREAVHKTSGAFRGDAKVRYFDRLVRHMKEAEELTQLFTELPENPANQSFVIRQQALSWLHDSYTNVIEVIAPLRKSLENEVLADDSYEELFYLETELHKLRSAIGKWRDHPSQKLGAKLQDCLTRMTAIALDIPRLKQNAQYECQQLGIAFYNRAGPVKVSRIEK